MNLYDCKADDGLSWLVIFRRQVCTNMNIYCDCMTVFWYLCVKSKQDLAAVSAAHVDDTITITDKNKSKEAMVLGVPLLQVSIPDMIA